MTQKSISVRKTLKEVENKMKELRKWKMQTKKPLKGTSI